MIRGTYEVSFCKNQANAQVKVTRGREKNSEMAAKYQSRGPEDCRKELWSKEASAKVATKLEECVEECSKEALV